PSSPNTLTLPWKLTHTFTHNSHTHTLAHNSHTHSLTTHTHTHSLAAHTQCLDIHTQTHTKREGKIDHIYTFLIVCIFLESKPCCYELRLFLRMADKYFVFTSAH